MVKDLIVKNRSYRRFYQDVDMDESIMRELIDHARLSGNAANKQTLRFMYACDREKNEKVFSTLGWAGYLKDWDGPVDGEKPAAYVVILDDTRTTIGFKCDYGIAAQSILLGAVDKGFGGCMIATIDKERLRDFLSIPEDYEILLVIALGKPREEVVIETVGPDGDIKYWRDEKGVHHVPKLSLDDVILS